MKLQIASLLTVLLILSNGSLGIECKKELSALGNETPQSKEFHFQSANEAYTELQKVNHNNQTSLAFQYDYSDYIKPGGGGACASATAFNMLQGLRGLTHEKPIDPKPTILDAYEAIPELRDGRVTDPQMIRTLKYFEKYLPGHSLKISVQNSPQSKPELRSSENTVWNQFDGKYFNQNPNEVKMVIYAVHDGSGNYIGRHFVILKRTEPNNRIIVVDPTKPAKEFIYEHTTMTNSENPNGITRLARPGNIPDSSGWIFTLDTIFTVSLEPTKNSH